VGQFQFPPLGDSDSNMRNGRGSFRAAPAFSLVSDTLKKLSASAIDTIAKFESR
jgi:hypothetical protein